MLHLPDLETLDLPPSWRMIDGRTGLPTRIDRSACLEVRISEVRKLAYCIPVNQETGRKRGDVPVLDLPERRSCRSRDGRLETGVFVITARMLHWLGSRRPKRKLAGDYRGTQANAMRPVGWKPGDPPLPLGDASIPQVRRQRPGQGHRNRHSFGHRAPDGTRTERSVPTSAVALDSVLPGNPNRLPPFEPDRAAARPREVGGGGATDRKTLALPDDWSQPLRIEKWAIPTGPTSVRYYLVCPGCGRAAGEHIESAYQRDPRFPGLSRRPAGNNARQSERDRQCPHRAYYLFMPLVTEAEARDARFADLFLRNLHPHLRNEPAVQHLRQRYAPLLAPRTLLCRHCLGMRYGLHPETLRQHYHRTKSVQREYRP